MKEIKNIIRRIVQATGLYFDYLLFREKYFPSKLQKKEHEEIEMRKKFYSQFISKDDLCFDIGANVGNRTSVFVALDAKVIAVEPQKYCCQYLKKKFKNRVTVINQGCDMIEETKDFFIANSHAASSFSKEWITTLLPKKYTEISLTNTIKIQTTTLDNLIKQYGIPDFCKIDVEGYEIEVLKGLTRAVKLISYEYTVPELTQKAIECLRHLNQLGKIICNYSENETMRFALPHWVNFSEMIQIVNSTKFIQSGYGDIYVGFSDKV